MIRLTHLEQGVWDAFFVSVVAQLLQQEAARGPEYIAERAASVADEMLLERRERCVEVSHVADIDWMGLVQGQ